MPALTSIKKPIKGLILADSGMGKTGSLWSLADAGFKLKIYDADNNAGVLLDALKDNPKAIAQIEVCNFRDRLELNPQGFTKGTPKAWTNFLGALNKWPDGGSPQEWGTDTVMVVDTLTSLGKAALLQAQHLESKMGRLPEIQHYHTAGIQFNSLLGNLVSDFVTCHVLVLTHVRYVENALGVNFGLPKAIGEKLSEDIPIYFNTMLALKQTGKKVVLTTKPTNLVRTKVEAFRSVKPEYALIDDGVGKPGLAEFFADCGWESPK